MKALVRAWKVVAMRFAHAIADVGRDAPCPWGCPYVDPHRIECPVNEANNLIGGRAR